MAFQPPRRLSLLVSAILAGLTGCIEKPPVLLIPPPAPTTATVPAQPDWRAVARDEDVSRIEKISSNWNAALATARRARFVKAVAQEGALLDPAAALPRPEISPGRYRCRLIRLAGRMKRPAFTAYSPYFCYVELDGALTTLVKETGSERQAGRLWPDSPSRLIFLGTLALGSQRPPAYGEQRDRDLAGVLERVAPLRWRLTVPRGGDALDILEMVPFTGE